MSLMRWREKSSNAEEKSASAPRELPDGPKPLPRLLSKQQVVAATGLSRATIDRERRAGRFPPPIPLSPRRVGWSVDDIENWIADKRLGR